MPELPTWDDNYNVGCHVSLGMRLYGGLVTWIQIAELWWLFDGQLCSLWSFFTKNFSLVRNGTERTSAWGSLYTKPRYPAQGWINGTAVQCSTPDCRDDVCVRCPEGMFCPGLSLELPSQKPGFWAKAMVTVRDRGTGDGDHSPWPENVGMEIWGGPFTGGLYVLRWCTVVTM